jgi:hypothetical protein
LKNEVKKKMHVVRRAMLYQSHRKRRGKKKIFNFDLIETQSDLLSRERKRDSLLASKHPACLSHVHQGLVRSPALVVFKILFQQRRIYNEGCEIFAGA